MAGRTAVDCPFGSMPSRLFAILLGPLIFATAIAGAAAAAPPHAANTVARRQALSPPDKRPYKPIVLERSGGFAVGGRVIESPGRPNRTFSCDHGYLEYFLPWTPRRISMVLWHSSSTQVWQNRWDGGEGFKDKLLRRDYPVYLWDGPRVGRANWGCEAALYDPKNKADADNFAAWSLGPRWPEWWNDTQFPRSDPEAWNQAVRARYEEFDTAANVQLHAEAAAVAADSGRIVGDGIVYLTNSAAGLRALMTAIRTNGTNIRGIVAYECMGSLFPDNLPDMVNSADAAPGGFGPFVVPLAAFQKLARLTIVQFVWGDHRSENSASIEQSRRMAHLINQYGGNAEVLMLGRELGLRGSSHIAFADMDNDILAGVLDDLLRRHGLDGYA